MVALTITEMNKIQFFTSFVVTIPVEFLLVQDYEPFQYSFIQSAIANCETNFALISSSALLTDSVTGDVRTAETRSFPLQTANTTTTVQVRRTPAIAYRYFYASLDSLYLSLRYDYGK